MEKKQVSIILISIFVVTFLTFFSISFFNQPLTMTGFAIYSNQSNETYAKDTYIRENTGTNYGGDTTMKIGKTAGALELKALLEYNVSSIPSGDTIVIATLQVHSFAADNSGNVTLQVRKLTSEWDEIAVNWTYRTGSDIWGASGGDYPETIYSTVQFTNQSGIYYNFTITDLVTGWVNGSYENYGLIIIAPSAANGEIVEISSSASATEAQRPLIYIDHTPNAAPTISNFSVTTTSSSPARVGEQINFTATWSDLENDNAQLFVCNTSEANATSCTNGTFCNTSLAQTSPVSCFYTVTTNDNRTMNTWAFVCDGTNCSDANASQFYINHIPEIKVKTPNGGETINITANPEGYTVTFNFSDADSDLVNASLYYGAIQNSTTSLIDFINLNSTYCTITGGDTATTPNNCNYNWNTTGLYGTYYLTIVANDSFHTANDSSDASFNVYSLVDNIAPNITAQWMDSGTIYSGRQINFYANVSDDTINTVWVSINSTSQTNYTMRNTSATQYNYTWAAEAVGNYTFKVWANDTIGNLNNSMSWTSFNITKPNATAQNATGPSSALPYHTIQITGKLNATDSLRDVYAYLNIPEGFIFLSNYSQNSLMGNFTTNQTKTATWFLGTPITEATYILNITYTDNYNNQWNSSNIQVQVTSGIGGYEISMTGSPEIAASETYYAEAYFKQSGTYAAPDSMSVIIYDSAGNTKDSTAMTNEQTGIYNHSYAVGAAPMAGIWETIVNATKSGISYYAHEFWKVVGALFDVRDITIINTAVDSLNISVVLENIGNNPTDLVLDWNLTRVDTGASLTAGRDTIGVGATPITKYISPSTTYVGQVRITFTGTYLDTEQAGAYKIFSTTTGETPTPIPTPSPDGGGGGGVTIPAKIIEPVPQVIFENLNDKIYLARNIEKTIEIILNNTGENKLNNIILSIFGLNKEEYEIQPSNVDEIKIKETKKITVKFLIKDLVGEKDVQFKLTSNELDKTQDFKLIVVSTKEFFLNEIDRLTGQINILKSILEDEDLITNLKECESIVRDIRDAVEKGEYINAEDYLIEAEECIKKVGEESRKRPLISFEGIWVWITTWGLMLILITAIIILIYILIKRGTIMDFMKKSIGDKRPSEAKGFSREIKEGSISKRLERLKLKIAGQKSQPKISNQEEETS